MYNYYYIIVPSDSPQSFESFAEQFLVNFTWSPPNTPNGIITGYNLIVTRHNTDDNTYNHTSYNYDPNTLSVRADGFLSFQEYNASITASTVIGSGPMAINEGRTQPDG